MSDNPTREPSPREKIQRIKLLARRAPAFWRGALVIFTAVFIFGILAILRLPRIYESETVVLARDAIRTDPNDSSPRVHVQRLGPKIRDLLLARSRLEAIITELGLYADDVERFGMVEAVEEMRTQIGFRARDSDMFVISFQSVDRDLAQRVAARLAESMIDEFVRDNVNRTRVARDFLADEERRAEQELEEKGRALAEFLNENPQFAWDPSRMYPGVPGQMSPMGVVPPPLPTRGVTDPELLTLQRERARLEEQLASDPLRGGPSEAILGVEEARMKAQSALAQAQAELAEKREKLTEEHPDVIALRSRVIAAGRALGEADAALAQAKAGEKRIREPVSGEAATKLRQQLSAIKAAIAARERALSSGKSRSSNTIAPKPGGAVGWGAVELETEWQRLVREVSEARSHKEDVGNKRARAELAASATMSSGAMMMTIIDPAYRPTRPIKPKRMILGLMTLGLSATLGALWAFARVLLDDVVFDAADIESKGGPRVLVSIPRDPIMDSVKTSSLVVHREREAHPPASAVTPSPPAATPARQLANAAIEVVPTAAPVIGKPGLALAAARASQEYPSDQPESVVEVIAFASPRAAVEGDLPLVGLRAIAALRILRYRIEQRAEDGRMVIGITSAAYGEGKSRLAIQLALALAESDRARVLLVEANLEHPSLARLLGIEVPDEQGFSMQMRRRALEALSTPWGVVACGGSLHLLAESPRDPSWPGMLHSREFRLAIEELRPRYDYIVVDGPSILDEGGATSVERVVDGFAIVARARVTRGSSLSRAARLLGHERMLGVVLTDVEEET